MANNQTFTRLSVPDPHVQRVISDLYDKLAAVQQPSTTTTTTVTPAAPSTTTLVSIAGASGTAAGPQFAFVPRLTVLPSNNPTTGAPYAQNGLLIEVNSQLWRYAGAPMYQWQQAGTATTILTDTHANRVANFPADAYPNALFLESDTLVLLVSNSIYWETVAGEVEDTHANRLSTWPSVQFSVNTPFYETDRNVTYTAQNAVGTVTVAGGVNVTWTAGHHFINTGTGFNAAQWPVGTAITIAGVAYAVSVVNSSTSLTLVSAAVNGAGQAYSVVSGRWVYLSGRMENQWSTLPSDLGENEATTVTVVLTLGFLFFDSKDSRHEWQWTGTAYTWGPDNDCQPGTIALRDAAPDPITGWHAADGSVNQTKYAKDGTRVTNFTVPDMREFYLKSSATYTGSGVSAVAPTITSSGATGSSSAGITLAPTTGNDNGTPLTALAGAGVPVPAEPHTHNSPAVGDPGHVHSLGSVTAGTDGTPATFAVLPYYRL